MLQKSIATFWKQKVAPLLIELESRVVPAVSLLGDFNPITLGADISPIVSDGSFAYFTANDGFSKAVWKTDGTAAGTIKLKDIGSNRLDTFLTPVNGVLYFVAFDSHGAELWKSNGTPSGTMMVKNITPDGPFNIETSGPKYLTNVGGTLYFSANDGSSGRELWKSDGTEVGTKRVRDIQPGVSPGLSAASSYGPRNLANINGVLYFSANDGQAGYELWKSNGSENGTSMVADIKPGGAGSDPGHFVNLGGMAYFTANGPSGNELWKSSGTGAEIVKDINTGSGGSYPSELTVSGAEIFFSANDGKSGRELWKTNGTADGTKLVSDIFAGANGWGPEKLVSTGGGRVYFIYGDGFGGANEELWTSDGTVTDKVMEIYPDGVSSNPNFLTNLNGVVYFTANDGINGYELWKANPSGASLISDISTGAASSEPQFLAVVGDSILFSAVDLRHGRELWKSDGSDNGTTLVIDINQTTGDFAPYGFTEAGGFQYFFANDGLSGFELWRTDGTNAGTRMIAEVGPGSHPTGHPGNNSPIDESPRWLTNVNGTLYFVANDGVNGSELWKSDGTAGGTGMVADIRPGSSGSDISYLTNVNGTLFFCANDGFHRLELWKTDGSGATLVKDINKVSYSLLPPPPGQSLPDTETGETFGSKINRLANIGGRLFFWADDGHHGFELWKSDGTATGTALVNDINTKGSAFSAVAGPGPAIGNLNGNAVFSADDGTGIKLWRSDGTTTNTIGQTDGNHYVKLGNSLIFRGNGGLWKTNGTLVGTTLIQASPSGAYGYSPKLVSAGGFVFYIRASSNDNHGTQQDLWKTNGEASGTVKVMTLPAGYYYPDLLGADNGVVYFKTTTDQLLLDVGNDELWRSDGTESGTIQIAGKGGRRGQSPLTGIGDVLFTGGQVFFSASDSSHGAELWKVTPNQQPIGISLTASSVPENSPAGVIVGNLDTMDPDSGDTFTYAFSSGQGSADNAFFNISGNQLRANASFNFEARQNYSIRVRTTDQGGLSYEKVFSITVTNVNESPTGLSISSSSIPENAGGNAVVGSFTPTDPDAGDSFAYALVAGIGSADNSLFNISDGQLRANGSFNFEARSSYSVRLRVTDQGGLSYEKEFAITVTDVNEAPTGLSLSATTIAENAGSNAVVGILTATDQDAGTAFHFSLVQGSGDNGLFNINGNQLRANASFDFETRSSYAVQLRVSDQGGLSFDRSFMIMVSNIDEGPLVSATATISVVANLSTAISGLSVVDPLAGATRLTTTLSATTGRLTLGTRTGLVFLTGDGVSDATIKFTGTLAQTNAALKSATFITATDTPAASAVNVSTQRGAFVSRGAVSLPLDVTGRVVRVADPALAGKFSIVVQGTESADTLLVTANGTSTSSYTVKLNGVSTTLTGITGRIVAFGLGGDDDMDLSGARVAVRADGGEGNDGILGGRLADSLFGGNGADLIAGGLGADSINGGAGNDLVIDGSVSLSNAAKSAGKTLRSILEGLVSIPTPSPADFLAVETDLLFTADKPSKDTLTGGLGTDWFWSATAGAVADVLDRSAIERRRLI